jgi:ribosomal protein L10
MPRKIKELMVQELEEKFRDVKETGCVLIDYMGIRAYEAVEAREEVRRLGGSVTVVKNSCFALAMENLGAGELRGMITGPTAVVRADNPVDAAKGAREIARTHGAIAVRCAYVDGRVLSPDEVEKLADIPGREELLSILCGAFMAPLRRLAFAVLAKPRAFLNGLQQLKERTEQEGA